MKNTIILLRIIILLCIFPIQTFACSSRPIESNLSDVASKTVASAQYSAYKLGGTHFDPTRGIYILDCSHFVNYLVQQFSPQAYSSLTSANAVTMPSTQHYYRFFSNLSQNPNEYWNKIDNIEELQPGDILVFRYKNSHGKETGGHIMVVMDKPSQTQGMFFVRVADSAPTAHCQDTRVSKKSGIGIGTLFLKANPSTGQAFAYAWGWGAYWNEHVKIAMARLKQSSSNII